jgi:ribosomal protein S18 acetylase RimI-like enzyme
MVDFVIRRATRSDEASLLRLAQRLATSELPRWRTASTVAECDGRDMVNAVRTANPEAEVFIAERNGEPAGCLHILETTDFFGLSHAHISVIATSATAEGTGVGRALMAHAEEWTRHRNLPLLTLNVFATNSHARRFYEKAGFDVEFLKYAKPMNQEPH